MRATTRKIENESPYVSKMAATTEDLMLALSCGRKSAVEIGTKAKARCQIGRRVLWNMGKVQAYLDSIAV
ncbi:MAG: hypothetical protein J6X66_04015 [Lachnospiraceae bacterium]|nr:hypothetical protein [Lachnospiraceae bacterium]